jgi:hypothetical protein
MWPPEEMGSDAELSLVSKLYKIDLGICIAPSTQPFRAPLGAKSTVCYPGNTADR